MHIFLTGEIQVGKSTIVRKIIEDWGIIPGGFITYFTPGRRKKNEYLYIGPAWEEKGYLTSRAVAMLHEDRMPEGLTQRFETEGVAILRESRKWAKLIVMDELGIFEGDACAFQREIISCLDGNIPVIGVIKKVSFPSWLDGVKAHPKVKVIEVDQNNRDAVVKEIVLEENVMRTVFLSH